MAVSDICTRDVIFVEANSSMQFAANLMKKHHVGALVVVGGNGSKKAIGLVTDRDLALHVLADGMSPGAAVDKVMSRNLAKVTEQEGIGSAIQEMQHKGVRRLIITNDKDEAVGIVSTDDVIRLLGAEMNNLGRLVNRELKNESQRPKVRRPFW